MSDLDAIVARHNGFLAAFANEDLPVMAEHLTEDHTGMAPNRPQMSGRTEAQDFWREGFAAAKSGFTTRAQDVTVAGDIAVDHFKWDMTIAPHDGSPSVQDTGKCLWIWRREADGAWRLAMAIWNSDLTEPGLWAGA